MSYSIDKEWANDLLLQFDMHTGCNDKIHYDTRFSGVRYWKFKYKEYAITREWESHPDAHPYYKAERIRVQRKGTKKSVAVVFSRGSRWDAAKLEIDIDRKSEERISQEVLERVRREFREIVLAAAAVEKSRIEARELEKTRSHEDEVLDVFGKAR